MKALLIGEYREGKLLASTFETMTFAETLGAETVMFLCAEKNRLPAYDGTIYLASASAYGEWNPEVHKALIQAVVRKERPDMLVFSHSSYGWDLAPRMAMALHAAQISEVVDAVDGEFVVPVCNGKLRRNVKPATEVVVVTLQPGAFAPVAEPSGTPTVRPITAQGANSLEFAGYESATKTDVDLTKAEVLVSAGRGMGKPENMKIVAGLARALGGEFGASRPVVDAGWADRDRQVGTTGATVCPKLYMACGISGAVQHLAGMRTSDFIVAVNTDKEAPIVEVADVLVAADAMAFVPVLTDKLSKIKG